jgi:hypothetical protein
MREEGVNERAPIPKGNLLERMRERRDGQLDWLRENHPEVFNEQKHLDGGSPERAYYHFGYASALRDVLAQMPPASGGVQ